MERDKHGSIQEFFEANRGKNVLAVPQRVLSPIHRLEIANHDLAVGRPEEAKLSHKIFYTAMILGVSEGKEIKIPLQGRRLEKSILHLSKTGQIVLIFDSDDLNFPYLEYLSSLGAIKPPFVFAQLDAHVDISDVTGNAPKDPSFEKLLEFNRESVGIGNFLTAMASTGFLKKISHANPSELMVYGGSPPEVYSNIKKYGVEFQFVNPHYRFFNRFPKMFKNEESLVLAFDIDFFGHFAMRSLRSVDKITKGYLNQLKKSGYDPKKVPVICIATSPGFNDGYQSDEEKLEIVQLIIDELNLH